MKNLILTTGAALCLPALLHASDVNLTISSGGSSAVNALPGAVLTYEVSAELSDANNEGLALLCFDLEFDGGPLNQADVASGATQLNFATPLGLCNPTGYGGTPVGGKLLQVGGAQNTIKNSFAPAPTGTVITDVGAPGTAVLFASGSLTAPATPGTYYLDATNLLANTLRQGETGAGVFWAVDKAGPGVVTGLLVNVLDCAPATYCTAKTNSQGCAPSIGWSGSPTLTGADDLHVTASNVLNNKAGLMFWGGARLSNPWFGGTLCVRAPQQRTALQLSGGTPSGDDCTGTFDFPFTQAYMASFGLAVGTQVNAQYWYRDPAHSDGTAVGMSNGLEFTICP